ncbi:MAG: DUF2235 domain-containing protein [Povalibacter sp.]
MPKNIIICSDGTGNTALKGRGTNVFKIFESVDLNSHRFHPERSPQVAIYDDGVGTEAFKLMRILGGAAGYGLSRNVRQLYRELCRIYDPGDQIYLFGFSRGAFTVRSLSGFIGTCGIIDPKRLKSSDQLDALVERAYRMYRGCYRTWLMRKVLGEPKRSATRDFRSEHCHGNEKIHFIGVWDTVDAVGLPLHVSDLVNKVIYQFKFPDLVMSSSVERAVHALSIDDERQSFHPLIWDEQSPFQPGQSLEQVWFAGVHSNVGGGYPKQGMSLVALDWIMHHAENAGLRFIESEREYYREHANSDDKLYDPRSGAGKFYRWSPRNLVSMCKSSGLQPKLHLSVLERVAHGTENYCPGNLPANAQVVITPTGDPVKDASATARALAVQQVLRDAHRSGESLLDSVAFRVRVGRFAYRVFVLSILATVLLGAWFTGAKANTNYFERLFSLLANLVMNPIDTVLHLFWRAPASFMLASILIVGLAAAALLSRWSTHGMNEVFRGFWFTHQQNLREAMKRARAQSTTEQALRKVATAEPHSSEP